MDKENTLEQEWLRNVNKIAERNTQFKELGYFINTVCNSASSHHNKDGRKLVILGNLFPIEIARALDIDYYCVNGGSFAMTLYQNDSLPKDADDVAKSIAGFIKSEELGLSKLDVVLIPLYSDNMRKLGTLIKDYVTVMCYEVPINKESPIQTRRYIGEINRIIKELEKHFHKNLSSKKLNEQLEISKKASEAFNTFESLYSANHMALSASAFLMVANSYHLCKDTNEWIAHLTQLNREFSEKNNGPLNNHPEIILLASPIYGPNYKGILLIEELGLNIRTIIHPDIQHLKLAGNMNCNSISVRELVLKYLESDISPVYMNNTAKSKLIEDAIDDNRISGIIAPVIRGQIDYEYEIKSVEKLIKNRKISLIRIETIYGYHDYEQIRVRVEAFSEMLNRKGFAALQ